MASEHATVFTRSLRTRLTNGRLWPSLLSIGCSLGSIGAALLLGGPGSIRLNTLVVGVCLGLLGGYNLYRTQDTVEHPDSLRASVLLGLWLIAFSLDQAGVPMSLLVEVSIVFGGLAVGVNGGTYLYRFTNAPERRRQARDDGVRLTAIVAAAAGWLRDVPTVIKTTLATLPTASDSSTARPQQSMTGSPLISVRTTIDMVREPGSRRYVLPLVLAIPVGIGAGIGAAAFRFLMYAIHTALFGTALSVLPSRLFIVAFPIAGAAVAGILIYRYAPEAAGHGVPENMEAIADSGGRIRHRLAPFKVLVSALTLGTGGSGGREGPIARIGAGVGSSLGQLFGLSAENTRLLLAAGIAGGIGATFGAPIGGILFGLEIVMVYRIKLFNTLVLGVTTLTAVRTAGVIAPHFTWFTFLPFALPELTVTPRAVLYALPYGLLMGVVAWVWVAVLNWTERGFEQVDVADEIKPAIGAIPVGILGIWYAKYGVMGVGYSGLRLAVTDVTVGAGLLVLLAVAKLVATQFTIGSGGSGGVFAPTLFIGGLFAVGVHQLVGVLPVSSALIGIVGMGAIFSGTAFAPLTAMFLVAEVFDAYALVAVLAGPCLLSYVIARRVLPASIYTSRLHRHGLLADYARHAEAIGPTPRDEPVEDVPVPTRIGGQSDQSGQPAD